MRLATTNVSLLLFALLASPAQSAVFVISFTGQGRVSVDGGPESAVGSIELLGYGDSANAVNYQQSTPPPIGGWDVVAPLDRLFFRAPGIEAEAADPGAFINSRAGGPSTQAASLDGTQLHFPFTMPALFPLNLTAFGGSAYAYQPDSPFRTNTGDVITYRYTADSLFLSGGPSSLPPPAAMVPEPATITLLLSALVASRFCRSRRRSR